MRQQEKSYLNRVREQVDVLKPQLETILGNPIDDFPIRTYEDLKAKISENTDTEIRMHFQKKHYIRGLALKVLKRFIVSNSVGSIPTPDHKGAAAPMTVYDGTLYINDKRPIDDENILALTIVHELGHLYIRTLNKDFKDPDFQSQDQNRFLQEGFCEFLSLDMFPKYSNNSQIQRLAEQDRSNLLELAHACRFKGRYRYDPNIPPSAIGYEFFRTVTRIVGREKMNTIIMNPPDTVDQFYNPTLYLEKIGGYPAKGAS